VKRNKFNAMLRHEYAEREPFFDLAKLESTFPDGSQSTFTKDGSIYSSLVPDYTNDGGHLNEKGRRKIAEHLLVYLAQLSQ
jgi:lysophospholipase L1-like esterase